MPPPMRYPEKMLTRLRPGTRERIAALQTDEEELADTQRAVIERGLDALEAERPKSMRHNGVRPAKPRVPK